LQRIDLTNWRSSTKIEAVMEELEKTKSRDPNAKTLIFSQFVNFLDLIEWRLKLAGTKQLLYSSFIIKKGFGCVKLDGRMTSQQKDAAIQKFNTDPDTCVFLISLKGNFKLCIFLNILYSWRCCP
jgi:DNA repair protein RAD16